MPGEDDPSGPTGDGHDEWHVTLPPSLRDDLKSPLGPIETDAEILLEDVSGPLFAVGDVVTYHLVRAGTEPDLALVDGITKREAVDDDLLETVTDGSIVTVDNPPATITADLAREIVSAIDADEPITLFVEGEEDLAVLPVIVAAPDGASVVYGQPDEGMVHVVVDATVRAEIRALLDRFDGATERLLSILES
ncbi:GTP-dependent dephospho-CoA kinase family protein [Halovivax gelatinilyticus]|uniref:GTP-dependent dephospho-CoA kinase family protein n=1 Tax=Halovivax gelatinilyticus TaxID=2961597 RepID=UPI0020CA3416|nr:GTP-dependent dephospho-CoA kinase family protein [Halovivax gelatinilyticus]